MTQFPNLVQAALLFDRPNPIKLDTLIETFVAAGTQAGVRYNRLETKPDVFYRLFGNNVMITVEYIGSPAKTHLFETGLGTAFTQLTNPNARKLIAQHRSHILIGVHHGAMPQVPEVAALLAKLNMSEVWQRGQSLDHFRERLSLCATLARLAHGMGKASIVHWVSSDHILIGDVFANLAARGVPSLLHVHPLLSSSGKSADGQDQIEITTFGAKYFVGREVHVAANPIPWLDSLALILSFLNIAMTKNGYVIPDGDTFGDDERTLSCRVRHIPDGAKSGKFEGPLYRLDLLFSGKHRFVSPDYVAPRRVFDDRSVPADILSDLGRERSPVVEDIRTKREMVERLGGHLEVSERTRPPNAWNLPRVFGRKKPQGEP